MPQKTKRRLPFRPRPDLWALAKLWAAIETLGLTHYAYHPCDEPMLKHVQYRPGFYTRDKDGKEYELVLW